MAQNLEVEIDDHILLKIFKFASETTKTFGGILMGYSSQNIYHISECFVEPTLFQENPDEYIVS